MAAKGLSEKAIENQILIWLRMNNIFCFKIENQGTYDSSIGTYRRKSGPGRLLGISDIVGLLPSGQFFAIEVKSASGRPTDHQKIFIDNVKRNGGIAIIAKCLADVEELLK